MSEGGRVERVWLMGEIGFNWDFVDWPQLIILLVGLELGYWVSGFGLWTLDFGLGALGLSRFCLLLRLGFGFGAEGIFV